MIPWWAVVVIAALYAASYFVGCRMARRQGYRRGYFDGARRGVELAREARETAAQGRGE